MTGRNRKKGTGTHPVMRRRAGTEAVKAGKVLRAEKSNEERKQGNCGSAATAEGM